MIQPIEGQARLKPGLLETPWYPPQALTKCREPGRGTAKGPASAEVMQSTSINSPHLP